MRKSVATHREPVLNEKIARLVGWIQPEVVRRNRQEQIRRHDGLVRKVRVSTQLQLDENVH